MDPERETEIESWVEDRLVDRCKERYSEQMKKDYYYYEKLKL